MGMFIHEAARIASEKGTAIQRCDGAFQEVLIYPTNARDCCIVAGKHDEGVRFSRYWNPTLEDLTMPIWAVSSTSGDKLREER